MTTSIDVPCCAPAWWPGPAWPAARCSARPALPAGTRPAAQRPAGAHPRRAERRRHRRLGARLDPRRPARPDVGRGQPPARTCAARGCVRGPVLDPGHRLHRQGAAARPAGGGAAALPGTGGEPGPARPAQRAADRLVPHRAGAARRDVRFVWTGDIVGQGWGINPDFGGMRDLPARCGRRAPTSSCAAATPSTPTGRCAETVTLPDGRVWRNLVTPEKSKVAETLAEYRGQFAYNLLDDEPAGVRRRGAADQPVGRPRGRQQLVPRRDPRPTPATPRSASTCSPRGPGRRSTSGCRSPRADGPVYRQDLVRAAAGRVRARHAHLQGPQRRQHVRRPDRGLLGRQQRAWLIRELRASRATWKVIANDLPLGLVVPDGTRRRRASRRATRARRSAGSWSSPRCCGPRTGAGVTGHRVPHRRRALHRRAPLRPGPRRGRRTSPRSGSSSPGRLHAGAFGPERPGRHVRARGGVRARPAARRTPRRPRASSTSARSTIDGESAALTVHLRDRDGASLWTTTLPAPTSR